MPVTFQPIETFLANNCQYSLLPFRFARIPKLMNKVLITNEVGEYLFLEEPEFKQFISGNLSTQTDTYEDLLAKHFLFEDSVETQLRLLATKYRTKKSFLRGGPSLHIFVVSLRCDHSCHYCQVSRTNSDSYQFDMSIETAIASIDMLFESPSRSLTVEFQGGEPLLAFPMVKFITEEICKRNEDEGRDLTFTITSTLHFLNDEILQFLQDYDFQLSTSLDGPEWIHNANRPNPSGDSYEKTLDAISRAREFLGMDKVSALTTLTRESLKDPESIIDSYIQLGFRSIFLRPLSPYGFAITAENKIGYDISHFIQFYERALAYILKKNQEGIVLEEAYTSILLTHILTPFPTGYVDLRSPTGSGLGVLVYNYDGSVYASDEGRMLAEMGNTTFRLGTVQQPYQKLVSSDAMQLLLASGVSESLPGCSDCAFLPYCGADPVFSLARCGDPVGHRTSSDHCRRHMALFQILFRYLAEENPDIMRIFLGWITRQAPNQLKHPVETL